MAQAAGVRVDHAENAEASVPLADDAAGDRLRLTVEVDVGDSRAALRARGQRGQGNRLLLLAHAEQHPADFLLAAPASLVSGEVLEQRSRDGVGEHDSLQPTQLP